MSTFIIYPLHDSCAVFSLKYSMQPLRKCMLCGHQSMSRTRRRSSSTWRACRTASIERRPTLRRQSRCAFSQEPTSHLPASPDMHEYGGIKDGINRKKAHIEKTIQVLVLCVPCIPLPAHPDMHASTQWVSLQRYALMRHPH